MTTHSRTRIESGRHGPTGDLWPPNSIKLLAQQVITAALDLIFPPVCVNCERVGSFLCPRCIATLAPGGERTVAGLDGVRFCAGYEGAVKVAIHALKYDHQRRLAEPLGRLVAETLADTGWTVDFVTAVPLHPARLRERGYNQAALLGQQIARYGAWPFVSPALTRLRNTSSQVHLTAQERRENVKAAFAADSRLVGGKRVLVVDDVLTTGSTLAACADALRQAGALEVYGAAVAGASFGDDGATGAIRYS